IVTDFHRRDPSQGGICSKRIVSEAAVGDFVSRTGCRERVDGGREDVHQRRKDGGLRWRAVDRHADDSAIPVADTRSLPLMNRQNFNALATFLSFAAQRIFFVLLPLTI
ncbi:MAG TPA: hypothetical protein VN689_09445, partial [Burkholderiales bacterium]|nr:hypothetical protein [Burkholderiales bacterium]